MSVQKVAVLAAAIAVAHALPAPAQDTTASRDSLLQRMRALERAVDSLRAASERQTQRLIELDERSERAPTPAAAATPRSPADTGKRAIASTQGIYGKPFVKRFGGGTSVGGYVDLEYVNDIDGHVSAFDQRRFIPFLYSEITDRLHFGAEIEFEHAPRLEVDGGEAEGGGEVRVEFATLDYRLHEAFNLRGGLVLAPLGRFNLVHDSPINDLTDRPLFDTDIIPSTLSEPGFGAFGTVYPSARSLLSYELYLVNGFTDRIFSEDGVRTHDAFSVGEDAVPFAKSIVGRVAFSPRLGVELGASLHRGAYARRGATRELPSLSGGDSVLAAFGGGERLTIAALDATVQHGPVELLAEVGTLHVGIPAALKDAGYPDRQGGYYLQGNYHFGHGWIPPRASSVFTAVLRYDHVDFDRDRPGDAEERLSAGLNWRPVPDAVFKTDFQWNWTTARGATDRGPAERRVRASIASYF